MCFLPRVLNTKFIFLSIEEFIIVFISDGKPKERYHNISQLYELIAERNSQIGNKVKIFTFGVGRTADGL